MLMGGPVQSSESREPAPQTPIIVHDGLMMRSEIRTCKNRGDRRKQSPPYVDEFINELMLLVNLLLFRHHRGT